MSELLHPAQLPYRTAGTPSFIEDRCAALWILNLGMAEAFKASVGRGGSAPKAQPPTDRWVGR